MLKYTSDLIRRRPFILSTSTSTPTTEKNRQRTHIRLCEEYAAIIMFTTTRLNIPSPSSLIPKFLTPKHPLAIDIPAVKVHEIDAAPEKPARALKHLLKLNHVNHAILFNHRLFHNHMPHVSEDLQPYYAPLSF